MTLANVLEIINTNSGSIAWIILIVLNVVEFSKIKIYPLTWMVKKISALSQKPIIDQLTAQKDAITEIKKDIASIKKEVNESSATTSRYRILRFDDELLHDIKHTKEHFDQIIVDIDVYEKFCERNPDFKNNLAVLAIEHITKTYQECKNKNSFL